MRADKNNGDVISFSKSSLKTINTKLGTDEAVNFVCVSKVY